MSKNDIKHATNTNIIKKKNQDIININNINTNISDNNRDSSTSSNNSRSSNENIILAYSNPDSISEKINDTKHKLISSTTTTTTSSSSSSSLSSSKNNIKVVEDKYGMETIKCNESKEIYIIIHGNTGTYKILQYVQHDVDNVYKAENIITKQYVCIKIQKLNNKTANHKLAIHEGIIHQFVSSDHHKYEKGSKYILKCYECIMDKKNDKHIIVMEYSLLGSILDVLNSIDGPSISIVSTKKIFVDIVKGLQFLHKYGIAHRDIKLENIFLFYNKKKQRFQAKIGDFGLSQLFNPQSFYWESPGSMDYAGPELLEQTKHKLIPTDIWALGVSLYILLNRYFPFSNGVGSNRLLFCEARQNIISNKMYDFANHVPISAELLVRRMLDPNPSFRPTIQTILNHRWITGKTVNIPGIDLETINNFSYNEYTKIIYNQYYDNNNIRDNTNYNKSYTTRGKTKKKLSLKMPEFVRGKKMKSSKTSGNKNRKKNKSRKKKSKNRKKNNFCVKK